MFVEYFGYGITVWENVRKKVVISCVIFKNGQTSKPFKVASVEAECLAMEITLQ